MTLNGAQGRPDKAGAIEDLLSLFSRRRSIRSGFKKDAPVPDEYISKMLEAARWAPSAGNSQPWEFLVIRRSETRHRIAQLYQIQLKEKLEIERAARGKIDWAPGSIPGLDFEHAPVHIIILGDPRLTEVYPVRTRLDKWESHFFSSLSNALMLMLLAGEALGLSATIISDAASPYFSAMLKSLLGIPEPLLIYQLVAVGFAKKSATVSHPRRPASEFTHYESYDISKFRDQTTLRAFIDSLSIRGRDYKW